jgi:uncharacterized OB-fold protein
MIFWRIIGENIYHGKRARFYAMYDELWSDIEIISEMECCDYCGQPRLPAQKICKMCDTNQDGVVFGVCRELLIVAGEMIQKELKNKKKGEKADGIYEISLSKVLDDFPLDFAKRTAKFERALKTEGVWFSHLVAFWMIRNLRSEKKWPITRVVLDEMYFYTRDFVFSFLKKGERGFTPENLESFYNFYSFPNGQNDARRVIYAMMLELEKKGRLKIARPKAKCMTCGKEISGSGTYCEECKNEQSLDVRMAITKGSDPPPLLQPTEPKPDRSGMHIRK